MRIWVTPANSFEPNWSDARSEDVLIGTIKQSNELFLAVRSLRLLPEGFPWQPAINVIGWDSRMFETQVAIVLMKSYDSLDRSM